MNPWVAISSIMALLLTAIGLLRWYQTARHPHPEVVRKLLHVFMGAVTVTFPWVFQQTWPVWVLAVLAIASLTALKYVPQLRRNAGAVVCAVDRPSYGDICFPLGAAILFSVAHSEPLLYCVPMVILTIADASSALIGIRFGKRKYSTADGNKTAEGSAAFFLIAAITTLLPLLMLGTETLHALVLSLLLACLVTMFEAIAWQGLDNLFIPLSAYAMLRAGLPMTVEQLVPQLVVACAFALLTLIFRHRTTLNDSAALGAGLFCYLSWAIGGWQWLVAPLAVTITHRLILPAKYRRSAARPQTIHEVVWVASLGFFWLWLSSVTGEPLLLPYTLTYAAHLALIGCAHTSMPQATGLKSHAVIKSSLVAWVALFLPYALLEHFSAAAMSLCLLGLGVILLCSALFCVTYVGSESTFQSLRRWSQQTGMVAAASFTLFALLRLY